MSSDVVFTAVREILADEWEGAPVIFPNEGASPADPSMPWVYCEVAGGLTQSIELGGGAWLETGVVHLHIFTPVGTGSLEVRAIAKQLSNLFRAARDSPVVFTDQNLGLGQAGDDDGMYWRQTLTIDYRYQDFA